MVMLTDFGGGGETKSAIYDSGGGEVDVAIVAGVQLCVKLATRKKTSTVTVVVADSNTH